MKWYILIFLALFLTACAAKEPQDFKQDQALYTYAMELYEDRSYSDAIPFFESLRNRFPQSPYAVPSELKIADSHFENDDFLEAEVNYQQFRALHPTHEKIPYVVFRIGVCHLEQIPGGPDRDQTETEKALRTFSEVMRLWPKSEYAKKASTHIDKAKRKLEERELYVANWYLGQDEYEAAIGRLNKLGQHSEFPEIKSEALYKLGYAYAEMEQPEKALPFLNEATQLPKAGKYAKKAKDLATKLKKP